MRPHSKREFRTLKERFNPPTNVMGPFLMLYGSFQALKKLLGAFLIHSKESIWPPESGAEYGILGRKAFKEREGRSIPVRAI